MDFNLPGKGLYNEAGLKKRLDFLNSNGIDTRFLNDNTIKAEALGSNIENFIGALTIPMGLIGPLKFKDEAEPVYSAIATTEGALVASTNRGTKAIGLSGGVNAIVESQNMSRCPVFVFENIKQSHAFSEWVKTQIMAIKEEAAKYSQHTRLKSIENTILGRDTHLMFNYTTGDAAGQNTTTTCTWHTCNWLIKKFNNESSFKIQKFYIESNGSSDKKISSKTVHNGRGIKVSADVFLPEKIINDVLKSSSAEMIDYTRRTTPISFYNGISSHNANVANLIAGIFSSTGQDIACVHESASAFGSFEKTSEGLYCSIKLPSLVIGTVGGGTHLPVQKNILSMMDCYGPKKVERFAKIIASFSLSLEISIIAAIASGQFAIAHERLGRNKLVDFVNKKEFKTDYIKNTVHSLDNIEFTDFSAKNNGILTQLTSLETQKHLGFSKWKGSIKNINQDIFIKSKPSNREVINSLYRTIGALDPRLASQFSNYQNFSEFNMSSIRELEVLEVLKNHNYLNMPKVYEIINDKNRESYHIIQEYIDHKNTQIFNSENNSHVWNKDILENVFTALYKGQNILTKNKENIPNLHTRNHKESLLFSKNMLDTLKAESSTKNEDLYKIIEQSISFLEQQPSDQYLQLVTHNDFNPRNIIVNKSEKVLIYDWELCSEGLPQKDSVEFLCFTKNSDHLKDMRTEDLLKVHFNLLSSDYPEVTVTDWKIMNKIALAQFITQRFSHYLVGSHLTEYNFLPNLISNTKLIFSELFNDQL